MYFDSLKCGSDVIVFDKNKQEIARGKAVASYESRISVQLRSGKLHDELMKHPELLIMGNIKYTYLKFSEYTGKFISFNFADKISDEVEALVEDTRAVDEFNFGMGICNQDFADYPGFRETINSIKTA
jgi:hypothetical protein